MSNLEYIFEMTKAFKKWAGLFYMPGFNIPVLGILTPLFTILMTKSA
jgi:hypothetical protein